LISAPSKSLISSRRPGPGAARRRRRHGQHYQRGVLLVRLQRDPVPDEQPHRQPEHEVQVAAEVRGHRVRPGQFLDHQPAVGLRQQRRDRHDPARAEPVRQPAPQVGQARMPGVREVAVVGQQQRVQAGVPVRRRGQHPADQRAVAQRARFHRPPARSGPVAVITPR
jgi:hypothetical protein